MTEKVFDHTMRTIKERNEHLEKKLDPDKLQKQIKVEMHRGQSGEGYNKNSTERYLEQLGSYLIQSPDIDSHRKVEDSFYLDERDYLTHNASGRNTYPSSDDVEDLLEGKSVLINQLKDDYVVRLFNPYNLSESDIRSFILNWGNYSNIENKLVREEIDDLQSEIESVANAKDFEMLGLLSYGLSVTDCAKEMGIAKQNVSKRIRNLAHRYLKQGDMQE